MENCIFHNTYLESPEFMKTSFHTSAIISVPISLLGFYMILFKTPEQMKSAKVYILNLHICNVLVDFCLNFLTMPLFLFPAFARIGFGWFQYIGVPAIFEIIVGNVFIGFTGFAILALFESRFYVICEFPGKKYWKFWRHIWLYGHYLYFIFVSSSLYFTVPDQDSALIKLMENIPCLPDHLKLAPIFLFADDRIGFQVVLTISIFLAVSVELILLFSFLVFDISDKLKNHRVSQKSVQIQKIFLTSLFLQTTVPLVTMVVPLLYIYYSVISNYYNQSLNNIVVDCMSTHGFISTIVMIMVHRPYRNALFSMVGKAKKMTNVSTKRTKIDVIKY